MLNEVFRFEDRADIGFELNAVLGRLTIVRREDCGNRVGLCFGSSSSRALVPNEGTFALNILGSWTAHSCYRVLWWLSSAAGSSAGSESCLSCAKDCFQVVGIEALSVS